MAKKIRGVDAAEYARLRHLVESGQVTEEELVRQGKLAPAKSKKGMATNLDEKIFRRKNPTRGKVGSPSECRVPNCTTKQSRRGLCNTHRVYASRMIKLGHASEQNLVNRGLLLSKNPSTEKPKQLPVKRSKTVRCTYPECKDASAKRGLCRKHYTQYLRRRAKLSTADRDRLEKDLIRRKLLLPETVRATDPFQLGSKVRGNLHKY